MAKAPTYPTARWFRTLGQCAGGCGKTATGDLMSFRNDRIGSFCQRCADRELKAVDRAPPSTAPDKTGA